MGEAWRQRQIGDRRARSDGTAAFVGRSKGKKAPTGFVDRGGGRGVYPFALAWIGDAPERAVEQQGGEVRFQDFGRVETGAGCGRGFFPQATDGAPPLPTGAAGALGGGRPAGAPGGERAEERRAREEA